RAVRLRDGAARRPVIIDGTTRSPEPERPRSPRQNRWRSPDGNWQIVVREHDLWLRRVENGAEFALDESGHAEDRYVRRVYWSPDSERVVVMRERPAQAHPVHIVEASPKDQVQPKLHTFDYLKPGDRIAERRPRLFDVTERREIPIDAAAFPNPWSLTDARWLANSKEFVFLHNERGHQRLAVLAVHRDDGSVRTIVEDRSGTFVDYSQKRYLAWSPDDRTLIWMSERSGYNHLYRIDVETGTVLNAITQGEWVVRGVEHIDFERGRIGLRAMGMDADQDPYHVHYAYAQLDGSTLVRLTYGDGTHDLTLSPGGTTYLARHSRVDLPPVHELRRSEDGALLAEIARADASALDALGWRAPERFVAKGRDGETDIWGLVVVPSNFDPSQRYPVLEQIYAGPHGHHVPKRFAAWIGARALAELGFVVGQIDGMGTNWRSKKFHDVCWRNLADAGFPDRIAWWRAFAAEHSFVDLERLGIYGGSAGGQNALRALIAHGDFYRAAVADCGCHDNRMDKIWWNEAWMGWPIGPHYAENSNVTHAHRVERPLMLIVGELDRNVDPASTMQVVDALIRADRDFDLIVMTGVGHGAAESPYGRRRRADFFVRNLMDRTPRWTP
ncbi:MAG: prolyl oligopeptidase family serine peptidase, partial [Planctomycetota bacterium]